MSATVNLGDREVGESKPCYVIGEIGLNHNGSLVNAEKLVDVAALAGADAVKLQKRTLDVCFTPEQLAAPRESPWGTTVGEYKRAVELGRREYVDLARYAAAKGLVLTASCWDEGALADVCEWIDPPWFKIASASITDHALLRAHAVLGKPLVISTGMSTIEEIDAALTTIGEARPRVTRYRRTDDYDIEEYEALDLNDVVLLHCTSTYPSEPEEINLECMATLRARYRVPVGYSGHERGLATSVAAAALGACVIERHITLDRTMWGSDHAASLEPGGLMRLVRDIRVNELARGDGIKRRLPREEPIRARLRRIG